MRDSHRGPRNQHHAGESPPLAPATHAAKLLFQVVKGLAFCRFQVVRPGNDDPAPGSSAKLAGT
jgi:hypothetical protein